MTTNPARQPKGRPTGGQFAAKANPESDIELPYSGLVPTVSPISPTTEADFSRMRQIRSDRADLNAEETNIARSLIASDVIAEYPSATHYVLRSEPDDMGVWYPDSIAVFDGSTELGVHELFSGDTDFGYNVRDLATSAWPDCTEDSDASMVIVLAATPTQGRSPLSPPPTSSTP